MTSEEALRDLCLGVGEAQQFLDAARATRDEAIAAAFADGMRMRDLVRVTGLTREHLRRIRKNEEGK